MTIFTDWCDKNGYDPEGEFVYNEKDGVFNHMAKIKLKADDNTLTPRFITTDGSFAFDGTKDGFVSVESITQNNFPTPPFKLRNGDKPEVRQWLKDNGCVWGDGDDIVYHDQYVKLLLVSENLEVTFSVFTNAYDNHEYPEITPVITPARVTGYTKNSKKEKLRRKIEKLQKKLDAME